MNTIDFSPFYRNTIGFDRFVSLLDNTLHSGTRTQSYPPYNIESIAVIQHVWKVNHTDDLIDLSAKAFLISLKDV